MQGLALWRKSRAIKYSRPTKFLWRRLWFSWVLVASSHSWASYTGRGHSGSTFGTWRQGGSMRLAPVDLQACWRLGGCLGRIQAGQQAGKSHWSCVNGDLSWQTILTWGVQWLFLWGLFTFRSLQAAPATWFHYCRKARQSKTTLDLTGSSLVALLLLRLQ